MDLSGEAGWWLGPGGGESCACAELTASNNESAGRHAQLNIKRCSGQQCLLLQLTGRNAAGRNPAQINPKQKYLNNTNEMGYNKGEMFILGLFDCWWFRKHQQQTRYFSRSNAALELEPLNNKLIGKMIQILNSFSEAPYSIRLFSNHVREKLKQTYFV